jgi:hypothetical protein
MVSAFAFLRYSNPDENAGELLARHQKATLIHELGHRHLSQFRSITKDTEDHPLLFLWLYDVWVKLYGEESPIRMTLLKRFERALIGIDCLFRRIAQESQLLKEAGK